MSSNFLETPEDLERVPPGTEIDDQGLRAVKGESGAWLYPDGQYWEPGLPAYVVVFEYCITCERERKWQWEDGKLYCTGCACASNREETA